MLLIASAVLTGSVDFSTTILSSLTFSFSIIKVLVFLLFSLPTKFCSFAAFFPLNFKFSSLEFN
jgi:hypothetical protein